MALRLAAPLLRLVRTGVRWGGTAPPSQGEWGQGAETPNCLPVPAPSLLRGHMCGSAVGLVLTPPPPTPHPLQLQPPSTGGTRWGWRGCWPPRSGCCAMPCASTAGSGCCPVCYTPTATRVPGPPPPPPLRPPRLLNSAPSPRILPQILPRVLKYPENRSLPHPQPMSSISPLVTTPPQHPRVPPWHPCDPSQILPITPMHPLNTPRMPPAPLRYTLALPGTPQYPLILPSTP